VSPTDAGPFIASGFDVPTTSHPTMPGVC